jgi:hypothetical protein
MNKIERLQELISGGEQLVKDPISKRRWRTCDIRTGETTYYTTYHLRDADAHQTWMTECHLFLQQYNAQDIMNAHVQGTNLDAAKRQIAILKGLANNWMKSKYDITISPISRSAIIDCDCPIVNPLSVEEKKLFAIWNELKNMLSVEYTPYSIGVMFRVLLDLSTEHYLSKNPSVISKDKSIKQKITTIARKFSNDDKIGNTEAKALEVQIDSYVSMAHDFIHSQRSTPAKENLEAFWANFKQYIILCLIT